MHCVTRRQVMRVSSPLIRALNKALSDLSDNDLSRDTPQYSETEIRIVVRRGHHEIERAIKHSTVNLSPEKFARGCHLANRQDWNKILALPAFAEESVHKTDRDIRTLLEKLRNSGKASYWDVIKHKGRINKTILKAGIPCQIVPLEPETTQHYQRVPYGMCKLL
jgi:hypothetical protein